jgi:hypothetical protein
MELSNLSSFSSQKGGTSEISEIRIWNPFYAKFKNINKATELKGDYKFNEENNERPQAICSRNDEGNRGR